MQENNPNPESIDMDVLGDNHGPDSVNSVANDHAAVDSHTSHNEFDNSAVVLESPEFASVVGLGDIQIYLRRLLPGQCLAIIANIANYTIIVHWIAAIPEFH